ncbi:excinuclease ABC subunit A [Luteibacter pinisoli]|uniref:Excinuclease ABC subunit A n=1 Tax=Luteibacter pinisoli TaxID=2589080 RepID=A0A4Y5Z4E8_9GAMM|nr:type II toxin-antitoxin system RelE/ParE family toxin [Luteibacter pinisoli]QDE40131.1 excinuclease ABC subunit A [Luteibacter pinisoli]
MILSFANKDTERLFLGYRVARWSSITPIARRKLTQLNAAASLSFLCCPPGNRLELLRGSRAGQYSIRINDQYRVCFRWKDGDVHAVEIVDYH